MNCLRVPSRAFITSCRTFHSARLLPRMCHPPRSLELSCKINIGVKIVLQPFDTGWWRLPTQRLAPYDSVLPSETGTVIYQVEDGYDSRSVLPSLADSEIILDQIFSIPR